MALRPRLAAAAQQVYDGWEGDGEDPELGSGGICDEVAEIMGNVISERVSDVEIFDGGQDGDDHAWVIAQRDGEAYGVDIPPGVYESGGGYNWRKRAGVTIQPDHVVVFPVPVQDESGYEDA